MSKKILVTSLAALGLSVFGSAPVLAEMPVDEARLMESEAPEQGTEQLLAAARALEVKLGALLSSEAPPPVTPENRLVLTDAITEIDTLVGNLQTHGLEEHEISDLVTLRQKLFQLILIQYEAPEQSKEILARVPTLEEKRYDDAVDFDEFDAELEELIARTIYLSRILDFNKEQFDQDEFAKDKAYLADVLSYLTALQEELYSGEAEVVVVPQAPVYWGEVPNDTLGQSHQEAENTGSKDEKNETGTAEGSGSSTETSAENTGSKDEKNETSITEGSGSSTETSAENTGSKDEKNETGTTEGSGSSTETSAENTGSKDEKNETSTTEGSGSSTETSAENTGSKDEKNETSITEGSGSSTETSAENTGSKDEKNETSITEGSGSSTETSAENTGSKDEKNETSITEGSGSSTETSAENTGSKDEKNETSTTEGNGSSTENTGSTSPLLGTPTTPVQLSSVQSIPSTQSQQGKQQTPSPNTTQGKPQVPGSGTHPAKQQTAAPAIEQTKSSLPQTGETSDQLWVTTGLLLASLGLVRVKRRQA